MVEDDRGGVTPGDVLLPEGRVLLVMASGAQGGGADHVRALMLELRNRGVDAELVVDDDGPLAAQMRDAGFEVEALKMMHSRVDPRAALGLANIIRRRQAAVVHLHGTRAGLYGAAARLRLGPTGGRVRWLYTAHGLAFRKEAGAVQRLAAAASEALICRSVDRLISVSKSDLLELRVRGFLPPGRGIHIPNTIAVERFGALSRSAARTRLGLDPKTVVLGTVGRLVPQKAIADLLAAFAALDRLANRLGPVELLVVGDGPLRADLEARAASLGGKVRFLGSRTDVPEILAALDIFVLSSHWEGEPIALLEAMATGLPCVATATGGAQELLEDGVGVLVPIGDVAALSAGLATLVEARLKAGEGRVADLLADLGKRARAAVADRQPARMAELTLAAYAAAKSRG